MTIILRVFHLPIGELPEEQWLALTRAGFEMTWADPVADLIAKMHLTRLTSYCATIEAATATGAAARRRA